MALNLASRKFSSANPHYHKVLSSPVLHVTALGCSAAKLNFNSLALPAP